MISRRVDSLTYGNLGAVKYNEDSSRWEFQRLPRLERCLHQISPTRILTQPILPLSGANTSASFLDRDRQIRRLLKIQPELTSLHSTVLRLTHASEAIQETPPDFDPSISELFAVGLGTFAVNSSISSSVRKDLRPFLAYPSGRSGETLRIAGFLSSETRDTDTASIESATPRLDRSSCDEWTGPSFAPIQQICTATPLERSACYVAVRKPTGTSIFRPGYELPSSENGQRLQWKTKFLFDIPISYTGGAAHIDVTFSPWEGRLFGILDALGHWSVFTTGKDIRTYHLIASSAPRPNFEDLRPHSDLGIKCEGSWGRLIFAGHTRGLVVCGRRDWGIFTAGAPSYRIPTSNIGLLGEDEIILDLKRDPTNPGLVFILTSSKLCWLRLAARLDGADPEMEISPTLIMSWHHHWNCTAFVVSLLISPPESVTTTAEDGCGGAKETHTLAIIYGRGTGLLEVFQTISRISPFSVISAADPFLLQISSNKSESLDQPSKAIQFGLRDISESHTTATLDSREPNPVSDVRYLQLIEIGARLEISQTILFCSPTQAPPPTLSLSSPAYQEESDSGSKKIELASHQNGTTQAEYDYDTHSHTRFSRKDARRLGEYMYAELLQDFNKPLAEADLARQLHSNLESLALDRGFVLLRDMVSKNLAIEDPEAVSEMLRRLLRRVEARNGSGLVVTSVLTPHLRGLLTGDSSKERSLSFSQVYDYMRRTWITSLPTETSNRSKVALDKQARWIALETFLCSIGLYTPASAPPAPTSSQPPPTSSQAKGKSKVQSSQSGQPQEPSGYSPTSNLARLISIPSTVQDPTDVLARITDEWIMGADPSEYDWTRVRGIEGGTLPPQQVQGLAEGFRAHVNIGGDLSSTQTTVPSSQLSQAPTQSQTARGTPGKPKKKRRKGF